MEAAANGVAQWFFVRAAATLRHGKMPRLFEAVPAFTPLCEVWTHHQASRGSSVRSDAYCLASHFPDCSVVEAGDHRRDLAPIRVRGPPPESVVLELEEHPRRFGLPDRPDATDPSADSPSAEGSPGGLGCLPATLRPFVITAQLNDPETSRLIRYLQWERDKAGRLSTTL